MIISPITHKDFLSLSNAVFLAGPCPRQDYEDDWRKDAIALFQKHGFNGDIINPTNPQYDGNLEWQTKWEHQGLCMSSYIVFWIPRDEKHPAFTTNIEFGEWFDKPNVFVGFPKNSEKNEYITERLKMIEKYPSYTLQELVLRVIEASQMSSKTYFTSDTHFTAQRTLELSYRPFNNVDEMDLQMISNWNKKISMNDEVIHLGDFGNPQKISLLNFKKMYFLRGNYERKDDAVVKRLMEDNRVVLLSEKHPKILINQKQYYLCHEPLNHYDDDKFYLYGHIHRLQLVKKNGINVGIDGNRFTPMSVQQIEFLRNGIENHFDENVFTNKCF